MQVASPFCKRSMKGIRFKNPTWRASCLTTEKEILLITCSDRVNMTLIKSHHFSGSTWQNSRNRCIPRSLFFPILRTLIKCIKYIINMGLGTPFFSPKTGFSNPTPLHQPSWMHPQSRSTEKKRANGFFSRSRPKAWPKTKVLPPDSRARNRKRKPGKSLGNPKPKPQNGEELKKPQKRGELSEFFCGEGTQQIFIAGRNIFIATTNNGEWEILLPHLIVD